MRMAVRREYLRASDDDGVVVNLADDERIVGVESEGNDFWVHIARPLSFIESRSEAGRGLSPQ